MKPLQHKALKIPAPEHTRGWYFCHKSGKQKPVSNPAEGKVLRLARSTHPAVHVPTASVPTVTSEYEKEKGEKNPKQPKKPTVYKIVEDKMLHITQRVPPLDYTRLDAALNQIDFAVSKEGMER